MVYSLDSLEEMKEAGLLEGIRAAASKLVETQLWRRGKTMRCLEDGGDGIGCRYVLVVRHNTSVNSDVNNPVHRASAAHQ